ncbi:alpha/beta hydrolase-fold protein [Gynurincola endophyticus]|uniref:alpha/beta hydrolase-fold protein n=1 Tax=Gynurincola endophyticus TaxID=2479004 RepID=UPI000F8D1F1D|nr:alpha/beta hydrolase-fold protein [Gynurincola endophyticus]
MKKYKILALSLLMTVSLFSQENYKLLSRKALETMWAAKDSSGYVQALSMYEDAFKKFPDEVDGTGLYKASVLAGELKYYDKAFYYLYLLKDIDPEKNGGFPGWRVITGNYSASEYRNLLKDSRWERLKMEALAMKAAFFKQLAAAEEEFFQVSATAIDTTVDGKQLYIQLKNQQQYLPKQQQNYSISFQINDSTKTSYFVHLPANYNPEKKYPLLVFLHGAVRSNALIDFQTAQMNLFDWNRYYTKYAAQYEVILVFPKGSRQYNWMVPDDGFFMVPDMVKQIRKSINVDGNKVFVSGHSNGATGSFSYLMKQPTAFAGFYGFNTYPKVFTGGTFVENIKNRSFINFSTDEDYYYPPNANDDFTKLMQSLKADYKEYRYNGFPHWFPQFDESEPAYEILFKEIQSRKRNPTPNDVSWEFDDEKYGNIDWLSNIRLDTAAPKANWHQTKNFTIDTWLSYNKEDSLVADKVNRQAFDFPRQSGKIIAGYKNNTFTVKTSCIDAFEINISPEMVDMNKKVKVYLNGKLIYDKKIDYDKAFMLQQMQMSADREQLWVNKIVCDTK